MSTPIVVTRRTMTGSIPFIGHRFGNKLRFFAGAGVNVAGAGILLSEALRLAGLTT